MQQLSQEELERIRRAYHIEHKSIRTIAKEFRHSRTTVSKTGEAIAIIGGVRQTVQYFSMRLNFSRKTFVMSFPTQKLEFDFWGRANDRSASGQADP
jgi:hypothetical protein